MNNEVSANNTLPEPVKKGQENIVVNQIVIRSADRSKKDIGDWKNAMQSAESVVMPNRTRLYDVYNDILIDGHLTGIIGKRIDAVLNKTFRFVNSEGKKLDEMDTLIDSDVFRDISRLIMETPFWGISGMEFIPGKEIEFREIPRKHIKSKWGIISKDQSGTAGVSYQGIFNLWIIGKPDDLGLLLKCAPYALLKRGNLADWAQFVEIYGRPSRVIKYESYDKQAKAELKDALLTSGGGLDLLIPKTADYQIIDGKSSNANGDLQNKFKDALNDEMSICVLGNTETTGNSKGGSNAKANTQRKDQLQITKSDIKYLTGKLNSPQFLDILKSYGYPVTGGKFQVEKDVDPSEAQQHANVIKTVKSMGAPVADDDIYEMTGVPKPGNYEELKKKAEEQRQQIGEGPEGDPAHDQEPDEDQEDEDSLMFTKADRSWLKQLSDKLSRFFAAPR